MKVLFWSISKDWNSFFVNSCKINLNQKFRRFWPDKVARRAAPEGGPGSPQFHLAPRRWAWRSCLAGILFFNLALKRRAGFKEKWTVQWTKNVKCERRNTGQITKVNCSLFQKFGVNLFASPLKLSEMKLWLKHKGTLFIYISPSQFPPENTNLGNVKSVNTHWSSPPNFSPQISLHSFSLVLQLICHSGPRTRTQYLSLQVLFLPFGSKNQADYSWV